MEEDDWVDVEESDDEYMEGDESEDEDSDEEDLPAGVVRQRHWKRKEIVKALADYDKMDGAKNLSKYVRYVRRKYKRPKFQRKTVRDWLKRRAEIEAAAKKHDSDRRALPSDRGKVSLFPGTSINLYNNEDLEFVH